MKRSDIPDGHVLELARAWQEDHTNPPVLNALEAEGIPTKLAIAKIEHMCTRGFLEYGVSPRAAWPVDG